MILMFGVESSKIMPLVYEFILLQKWNLIHLEVT